MKICENGKKKKVVRREKLNAHMHVRVSQRVKMRIIGWVLVYMRRTNLFSFLFFAAAVFPTTIMRRRRQQHWNIKKFFHLEFLHSSRIWKKKICANMMRGQRNWASGVFSTYEGKICSLKKFKYGDLWL